MNRTKMTLACAAALTLAAAPATASFAQAAPSPSTPTTHTTFASAGERAGLVSAQQAKAGEYVKALGLTGQDKLQVTDVLKDSDGTLHVRVNRSFKGIPVIGGDLVLHVKDGKVVDHDGMFDKKVTVNTSPKLAKDSARTKGLAAAKAYKKSEGLGTAKVQTEQLVIQVDAKGKQQLAYMVKSTGKQNDKTPSRVRTFIDANSGKTLFSYDEIKHAKGKGVYVGDVELETSGSAGSYQLKNPTTGNYTTDSQNRQSNGTIMTDSENVWGDGTMRDRHSAGVDAQYGTDKTYEYYKQVQGRNGIWNDGRGARSRVHFDDNYVNAFWDGQQMTYGDGEGNANPLTELDVVAHEISHGVTENSAALQYRGDAGGLNEATSDIFGTAVEWYAQNPADTPDYLMGEEVDLRGDGSPLRYMDKPSKDGVSYDCWSPTMGNDDPHFTSGPLNHWFYLAAEGSGAKTINGVNYNSPTCDGSTVTGSKREDVEKVWYRALSTKLTSTSDYPAAREASIKSAIELYGANSQVCKSVESAFNAIKVPAGSQKCDGASDEPSEPTDPTDPNEPAAGLVNGGFEEGQKGWTGTEGKINDNADRPAKTGKFKLWLGGNGKEASESMEQQITVPELGSLTFQIAIESDEMTAINRYDTMDVQIVDGSTPTTVASFSNLSETSGYRLKTVDLKKFAGKKVTLKFVMKENGAKQTSFLVDDVQLKG